MDQFQDLVILIPGITGSVLVDADNKDVWAPSAKTVWTVLSGGIVNGLALAADDIDDGITATSLVPSVTVVPGLIKVQGYSRVSDYIVHELNLKPGENFHEFPYDWRRDIRRTAQELKEKAEAWLGKWQRDQGNEHARIVLIGHSMGGLVARYFVECLEGWRVTRKVITLGTPHGGSVKALDFLVRGMKDAIGPSGLDLLPALRSMPSVYQLLPVYPCIQVDAGPLRSIVEVAKKNLLNDLDIGRIEDAYAFHQEINKAQSNNLQQDAYRSSKPELVTFVGIGQPTAQSARFIPGRGLEILNAYEGKDQGGDGTVPSISAMLDPSVSTASVYASEMHGALQNAAPTLVNIKGILTRPDFDLRRFLSTGGEVTLALEMADVVMPGEMLALRARRSRDAFPITVEMEQLGNGVVHRGSLSRDGATGWQRGEFLLGCGTWRVTLQSRGAEPVSDLLVVAK